MANAVSKMVIAKKKRKVFLDILAKTGQVTKAAHAVGYTSADYLHKMRREDELFAEEWAEALEVAKYTLEAEAIRRGSEGVYEPVYYKGEVVGEKLVYSDQLLMFVLRKMDPSYRDTGQRGDMNINFGVAVLPMTAQSEEDWEKRAVEMHAGQQIIEVEAKVVENQLVRVKRGD